MTSSRSSHHSHSESSTSSESLQMLLPTQDDADAVVYRERNIYDNDRDYDQSGRRQNNRGQERDRLGRARSWSNGDSRFVPSQNTQVSAPSPGVHSPHDVPSTHHNDHALARHERKRRVKAIEEADRADAQQAFTRSPLGSEASPVPWSSSLLLGGLGDASAGNPFADLEALVVQRRQQHSQQPPLGRDNDDDSFYECHGDDDDDDLSSRGQRDDTARRLSPTSAKLHKAAHDGAGVEEAEAATVRPASEEDEDIGHLDPSTSSVMAKSSSASQSTVRTKMPTGDGSPRRGMDGDFTTRGDRSRDPQPDGSLKRARRQHGLLDSTNSRNPTQVAAPPGRFLDGPPRSMALEHSRRQLERAARRPLKAPSNAYGASAIASSRKTAVVRVSSHSIVGSRPAHWGAAPRGKSANALPNRATSLSSFNKLPKSRMADVLDRRPKNHSTATISARPHPPSDPAVLGTTSNASRLPTTSITSTDPTSAAPAELEPLASCSSSLAPVSFVPSFLTRAVPCVSAAKDETQELDDVDDALLGDVDSSCDPGPDAPRNRTYSPHPTAIGAHHGSYTEERPLSPQVCSPVPTMRRSKNHKAGVGGSGGTGGGTLVRRLKSLRDAVKADSIRLQSGQHGGPSDRRGPTSSLFIMNDPRAKAESYMDVTLVKRSPMVVDSHHDKVTCLAYCHEHRMKSANRYGAGRLVDAADADQPSCSNEFLWLCVTFASAREWDAASAIQLRIYNPIVVTIPLVDDASTPKEKSALSTKVWFAVLSTYLCELYPTGSPRFPEPPAFPFTRSEDLGQTVHA